MAFVEKSAPVTLRALAVLTGSFVESAHLDVKLASYADLFVAYDKTSGTAMEFYVEVKYEGSDPWYQIPAQTAGTPASGAVAVTLDRPTYTMSADGAITLSFPVFGARALRVLARETGTADGQAMIVAVATAVGA